MTGTVEKRIETLEVEARRADTRPRVVIAEPGETGEHALRREGIAAGTDNVFVVVFLQPQPVKT